MLTLSVYYPHISHLGEDERPSRVITGCAGAVKTMPLIPQSNNTLPDQKQESAIARSSHHEKPEAEDTIRDTTLFTVLIRALVSRIIMFWVSLLSSSFFLHKISIVDPVMLGFVFFFVLVLFTFLSFFSPLSLRPFLPNSLHTLDRMIVVEMILRGLRTLSTE